MEDLTEKMFISTQGPTKNTFFQFWRMIYVNNSQLIIMLCNLKEDARVKCDQYWPETSESKLVCKGNRNERMEVEFLSEKLTFNDLIIERKFRIKYYEENEETQTEPIEKEVTQLHITCWPDHSIPHLSYMFKFFDYLVNIIYSNYKLSQSKFQKHSPTVVHCSAGVGRTGTFISIYNLFDHLNRQFLAYKESLETKEETERETEKEEDYINLNHETCKIDKTQTEIFQDMQLMKMQSEKKQKVDAIFFSVFAIVRKLREQRFFFVTDIEQYKVIYKFAYTWIRTYFFGLEEKPYEKEEKVESPVIKKHKKPYILKETIILNNDHKFYSQKNNCIVKKVSDDEQKDIESEEKKVNRFKTESNILTVYDKNIFPPSTTKATKHKDLFGSSLGAVTTTKNQKFNNKMNYSLPINIEDDNENADDANDDN